MKITIIDRQTGETLGSVITNRSLIFDEVMRLAGFDYVEGDNETGWTKDNHEFHNETTVNLEDSAE